MMHRIQPVDAPRRIADHQQVLSDLESLCDLGSSRLRPRRLSDGPCEDGEREEDQETCDDPATFDRIRGGPSIETLDHASHSPDEQQCRHQEDADVSSIRGHLQGIHPFEGRSTCCSLQGPERKPT